MDTCKRNLRRPHPFWGSTRWYSQGNMSAMSQLASNFRTTGKNWTQDLAGHPHIGELWQHIQTVTYGERSHTLYCTTKEGMAPSYKKTTCSREQKKKKHPIGLPSRGKGNLPNRVNPSTQFWRLNILPHTTRPTRAVGQRLGDITGK